MLDYTGLKVAVIGDFMLDKWYEVKEVKESPEGGPDYCYPFCYQTRMGGAGNLVAAVHRLDAWCDCYGVVGADYDGCHIRNGMRRAGIGNKGLVVYGATTVKKRYFCREKPLFRLSEEMPRYTIDEETLVTVVDIFQGRDVEYDAVIMSDYNKGVLTKEVIKQIMGRCAAGGLPVFVDPKFDNFWEYKGATIFKPNMKESVKAAEGIGFLPYEEPFPKVGWRDNMISELGLEWLVVTQAAEGLSVWGKEGNFRKVDGHKVKVVDVCGAGDAVMAVLSLEYLRTGDIFKAARLANFAGALAVQQHGTATITVEDLEMLYEQDDLCVRK